MSELKLFSVVTTLSTQPRGATVWVTKRFISSSLEKVKERLQQMKTGQEYCHRNAGLLFEVQSINELEVEVL